ncbi:hypothetical protein AAC387_Pa06g0653 [Persea americana]
MENCVEPESGCAEPLMGAEEKQRSGNGAWTGDEDFVRSIVYAGLGDIVTCFALISSISAGHLSSVVL